jgi:hypothetical protein
MGRLLVAKWLFEVGAAEDIRTKIKYGCNPLSRASSYTQDYNVLWLVLQGAANDETSGHVDATILVSDFEDSEDWSKNGSQNDPDSRHAFRRNVTAVLDQQLLFARLVLPAIRTAQAASAEAVPSSRHALHSKKPRAPQGLSPLALLCGHEDTLLALIADFVGVVRGRQLRNAREALEILVREEATQRAAAANGGAMATMGNNNFPFCQETALLTPCQLGAYMICHITFHALVPGCRPWRFFLCE